MKNTIVILAIAFTGYFGYQKYFSNDLYGQWQLDVEKMVGQLADTGLPQASIDAFRKQLGSGRTTTTISKKLISFEIDGQRVDYPYSTLAKNGKCTTIEVDKKTLDYCTKDNTLEVHNQKNAMFEVYTRL